VEILQAPIPASERVVIALVVGPEIVIPMSDLGPRRVRAVPDIDRRSDLGRTYVFTSHNLAIIEHAANRVAVMYLGRIFEAAPREAIFRGLTIPIRGYAGSARLGAHARAGLGIPNTGLGLAFPNPLKRRPAAPTIPLSRSRSALPHGGAAPGSGRRDHGRLPSP
jgi:peptide/nickel transport system ATP-binding protein